MNDLRIGGAELRALRLVERLPKDRFEFDFIVSSGEGPMDQRAREAGGRVLYVGNRPVGSAPLPARALGRAGKLLRYTALVRASDYDIVNAWLYPSDVVAVFGRLERRTPIIVAGRFDQHARDSFGPLSARVDAIVNARVDAIVANSEIVAAQNQGQRGVSQEKLHVIRNGVELTGPLSSDERGMVRGRFGADDGDVVVGSVGMLREVKRHDLLIDAFADVARSFPRLRLVIVGEGPTRGALEQQVRVLGLEGRVLLPGATADVAPLLDAFDIVVMSSRSEGLPNALLEAAAAGKPIVTTAAGGAIEVVVDAETGLVVPVEDQEALSAAMARLIADPQLRSRFGSAAREFIQQRFGMERFVSEWAALYEDLAVARGLIPG